MHATESISAEGEWLPLVAAARERDAAARERLRYDLSFVFGCDGTTEGRPKRDFASQVRIYEFGRRRRIGGRFV